MQDAIRKLLSVEQVQAGVCLTAMEFGLGNSSYCGNTCDMTASGGRDAGRYRTLKETCQLVQVCKDQLTSPLCRSTKTSHVSYALKSYPLQTRRRFLCKIKTIFSIRECFSIVHAVSKAQIQQSESVTGRGRGFLPQLQKGFQTDATACL